MILEKTWVKVFQSNSFFQTLPDRVMNSFTKAMNNSEQSELNFLFLFYSSPESGKLFNTWPFSKRRILNYNEI